MPLIGQIFRLRNQHVSGATAEMADTSSELLAHCAAAIQGSDFPTVWQNVLRGHRLVAGTPLQHMQGGQAQLRIPLLTGQFIVFDSASKRFSIL